MHRALAKERDARVVSKAGSASSGPPSSTSSLFNLPKLVLIDLLSVWVSPRDVCRLDVAMSDEMYRGYWLGCLSKCVFYGSRNQYDQFCKSALRWVAERSVSMLHLVCRQVDLCFGEYREQDAEDVDDECMQYLPESLVSLSLASCVYVEGRGIMAGLTKCKHINSLNLRRWTVDGETVVAITENGGHISHLSLADFTTCSRSGRGIIAMFEALVVLSSVDIRGMEIFDELSADVAKICGSRLVHFKTCGGDSHVITEHCPKLRTFYAGATDDQDDELVSALTLHCPEIEHLELPLADISGDYLRLIGTFYGARLRSLSICLGTNMDGEILEMLQNLRVLNALKISEAENMTDVTLKRIAELIPNLVDLSFLVCSNISGEGLASIADGCLYLRTVQIVECELITDDSYPMLATKWTQLERLDIQESDIRDASVLAIHHHCKQLKTLYFDDTPNISEVMQAQLPTLFCGVIFDNVSF